MAVGFGIWLSGTWEHLGIIALLVTVGYYKYQLLNGLLLIPVTQEHLGFRCWLSLLPILD